MSYIIHLMGVYIFYFIEHKFCYIPYRCSICATCVTTNINTIIEFVPNCL